MIEIERPFIDVRLSSKESYHLRSKSRLNLKPNTRYSIITEIIGLKGKPYSAKFDIILMDKERQIIKTLTSHMNSFSGIKKEVSKVFLTPPECTYAKLAYRINDHTLAKSDCHFKLLPLEQVFFEEIGIDPFAHYEIVTREGAKQTYHELSPEEEDLLERNIVWIFGHGRSGTTWLALQLLSHNTYSLNEPLFGKQISNFTGEGQGEYEPTFMEEDGIRSDYFFCYRYSDTWLHHLRKLILNRIYAQFKDLDHRIIIKEPASSQAAHILAKCLPNSKMIVILRDGRDVIDSVVDAISGWKALERSRKAISSDKSNRPSVSPDFRISIIKRECRIWNTIMRSVMEAYTEHSKQNKIMIRYEELRVNTPGVLKELYRFIDVPINDDKLLEIVDKYSFENIPDSMKGPGKFNRSASPGRWSKNFDEDEKQVIHQLISGTMEKIGYANSESLPVKKIGRFEHDLDLKLFDESSSDSSLITLSPEQEDALEKNIIWIFGYAKSGNRRILQQLSFADDVVAPMNEPRIGRFLNYLTDGQSGNYQNTFLEEEGGTPDYFFCYRYSDTWLHHLRKLILNRIYAQFKDVNKKIVIAEVKGSLAANILAKCLPKSKMIMILKNHGNIIDNALRNTTIDKELGKRRTSEHRLKIIKRECRNWNTVMRNVINAYESYPTDHRILVRYEELLVNNFEVLKKLFQFADIQVADDKIHKIIGKLGFDKKESIADWKKQFSLEEKEVINQMTGEIVHLVSKLK